jgi:hypothetical protein
MKQKTGPEHRPAVAWGQQQQQQQRMQAVLAVCG